MISRVHSCSVQGAEAILVTVEADISFGLPVFNMVGLAEAAVRESKERVRSAVKNSGFSFPVDRVVVNLAPADIRKEGTGLDLPVALAILSASGLLPPGAAQAWVLAGELSLDGQLKPVRAALPFALAARQNGFKGIILPEENSREAALAQGVEVMGFSSLGQVVEFLCGSLEKTPQPPELPAQDSVVSPGHDFAQVRGQAQVKRALEIGAAAGHHVLMSGPPGSGKSLMAKCLPGILPPLSFEEGLEVATVYSIQGEGRDICQSFFVRPFRSPHHSISDAGLVGGGPRPMPGEISLAHHGVLFLDELPEFRRNVLEVLRQPLEAGQITLARAGARATYPCRFMLVGAMNPCPCGLLGSQSCTCTLSRIQHYRSKLSGPLMDRMDIQVEVRAVSYEDLAGQIPAESSEKIRQRVVGARAIQARRFQGAKVFSNAAMGPSQVQRFCRLDTASAKILKAVMAKLGLSARAYASVLKIARTIADLSGAEQILREHLLEAVQYKAFEREIEF